MCFAYICPFLISHSSNWPCWSNSRSSGNGRFESRWPLAVAALLARIPCNMIGAKGPGKEIAAATKHICYWKFSKSAWRAQKSKSSCTFLQEAGFRNSAAATCSKSANFGFGVRVTGVKFGVWASTFRVEASSLRIGCLSITGSNQASGALTLKERHQWSRSNKVYETMCLNLANLNPCTINPDPWSQDPILYCAHIVVKPPSNFLAKVRLQIYDKTIVFRNLGHHASHRSDDTVQLASLTLLYRPHGKRCGQTQ